ncbi:hypothetical protein RIF29_19192 [Crotalaria pallida]|uniref:Uncharacterized protein n=1 Tax=Crotalaria pallida TaxID=3830 RepID=A0AAN9I6A2_CROPI
MPPLSPLTPSSSSSLEGEQSIASSASSASLFTAFFFFVRRLLLRCLQLLRFFSLILNLCFLGIDFMPNLLQVDALN